MSGIINRFLNRFGLQMSRSPRRISDLKQYIQVGDRVLLQNFNLEVRNKNPERTLVSIGSDSLVSGNYIFETQSGRITIGDRSFIGGGTFICINEINIGDDVMFSWGCTVMDNNAHSLVSFERINDVLDWKRGIEENAIGKYKNWECVKSAPITIKDKAWVGFNSIILKGVTIGKGAIIGAGSVVSKNVPDFAVVAGNPASIIRYTE